MGFEEGAETSGIVGGAACALWVTTVHDGIGGTAPVGLIQGAGGGNRRVWVLRVRPWMRLPIEQRRAWPLLPPTNPGGCTPVVTERSHDDAVWVPRASGPRHENFGRYVVRSFPTRRRQAWAVRAPYDRRGCLNAFPVDESTGFAQ